MSSLDSSSLPRASPVAAVAAASVVPQVARRWEVHRVALLTAGGLAPCLSAAVGALIQRYTEVAPHVEILCYRGGYKGLLLGDSFVIGRQERDEAGILFDFGGSPIGNSRVKLSNKKDCVARGLVKAGEDPLHVAAERLVRDNVDVLHTIGGDDTNTAAADLAAYLQKHSYRLCVIGLPKTIDNDVTPIALTLGAMTAAEEGAKFFRNVVSDHTSSHRMLLVHEVMGRNCGWLTAQTAACYMKLLDGETFAETMYASRLTHDVHAVYIPEVDIPIEAEGKRLRQVMDRIGTVNIFVSEGAGAEAIAAQLRAQGKTIPVDAFGHMKLDSVNVGQFIAEKFAKVLDAEKFLVQKSGYYARAAKANAVDLHLIKDLADHAVVCAMRGESGVVGHDEAHGRRLRAIEFPRIKGHKAFKPEATPWFGQLLEKIGQRHPTASAKESKL